MVELFAIRHKPSGKYMPVGRRRGFTHDEPDDSKPPRLFTSKRAATCALNYWLRGAWHTDYKTVGDHFGFDEVEVFVCAERSHRKAEDMEVIKVDVVESRLTAKEEA